MVVEALPRSGLTNITIAASSTIALRGIHTTGTNYSGIQE